MKINPEKTLVAMQSQSKIVKYSKDHGTWGTKLKKIKSRVTRCLLALFYYLTAWQHRTQQQHCGAKTMVCVLTESNFLAKIFKQSIKS